MDSTTFYQFNRKKFFVLNEDIGDWTPFQVKLATAVLMIVGLIFLKVIGFLTFFLVGALFLRLATTKFMTRPEFEADAEVSKDFDEAFAARMGAYTKAVS